MNLAIDVGNTLIKLGIFNSGEIKYKKTCIKQDFLHTLSEISEAFPNIESAIIASVGKLTEHQLSKLQHRYRVFVLDHKTPLPFINRYATPQTLGMDRIALVSAACAHYANKNVLVIDAGTCITYDFLNSKNEYLGGAISPGVSMRYNALHTFTEKLPLLEANIPKQIIGNSTSTAIHSGIVNGILWEIDGAIDTYRKKFNNLTVILTGGDTHFLRDNLKNDIFANSNFLLEGLNYILEYNKR